MIHRHLRTFAAACLALTVPGAFSGCAPAPQRQAAVKDAPPVIRSIMTADFPIREAMRSFDSRAHHYALSGVTTQGEHIRVKFSITPGDQTVFEGRAATKSRLTYTVDRDGDIIASASYTEFSAVDSGATLGSSGDRRYIAVTSGGVLPERAAYGATGVYFNANEYGSAAKGRILQTHTARYIVERGDDTNNMHAQLCLRYTMSANPAIETHCFKLDRAGNVTDPQIRFQTPGLNVTLR